jgi:hypothetical protein
MFPKAFLACHFGVVAVNGTIAAFSCGLGYGTSQVSGFFI